MGNKGRPKKEVARVSNEPVTRVVQGRVRREKLGKEGKEEEK